MIIKSEKIRDVIIEVTEELFSVGKSELRFVAVNFWSSNLFDINISMGR